MPPAVRRAGSKWLRGPVAGGGVGWGGVARGWKRLDPSQDYTWDRLSLISVVRVSLITHPEEQSQSEPGIASKQDLMGRPC